MARSMFLILGVVFVALPLCAAQPSPSTPHVDRPSADLTELVSVLRNYRRALADRDSAYLTAHTALPLRYTDADLDMEAKPVSRRIASIANLLRVRDNLSWPPALVPDTSAGLDTLKRGAEKCSDPTHSDIPDWGKGEPAFEQHGDIVTLTYLAAPCEATTHLVTLTFESFGNTWRLSERAIRLGTH
jgi:hypothetical protein